MFSREFATQFAVQIVIGLSLILIGTTISLVPEGGFWVQIFHHIGTAILTAGMLMITVELFAKYRENQERAKTKIEQDQYLEQLSNVQTEAMLQNLLPDNAIFEQIKSEIIQQPFIRRNLKVNVHLRWRDEHQTSIKKIFFLSYDLVNTSTIAGKAPVKIILDTKSNEDMDSRIDSISIMSFDSRLNVETCDGNMAIEGERLFQSDELTKFISKDGTLIKAEFTLDLAAKQSAKFAYKQTTLEDLKDQCGIYCLLPTIGFELEINPEPGIQVHFSILHPSGRVVRDDDDVKSISISGALLPYQGVSFEWSKKATNKAIDDSKSSSPISNSHGPSNPPLPNV